MEKDLKPMQTPAGNDATDGSYASSLCLGTERHLSQCHSAQPEMQRETRMKSIRPAVTRPRTPPLLVYLNSVCTGRVLTAKNQNINAIRLNGDGTINSRLMTVSHKRYLARMAHGGLEAMESETTFSI